MNEEDAHQLLQDLEDRVEKAEARIPELETQVKSVSESYAKAMDRNEELVAKLKRFEALETALKELLPSQPPSSIGTTGTLEVHESAQVVKVVDPREPLIAETSTLLGQVGCAIWEEQIVPNKRYRVAEISDVLSRDYEGKWGKGEVQQVLEKLTATPFRLFMHETDAQKRHWFTMREHAKDRVSK